MTSTTLGERHISRKWVRDTTSLRNIIKTLKYLIIKLTVKYPLNLTRIPPLVYTRRLNIIVIAAFDEDLY